MDFPTSNSVRQPLAPTGTTMTGSMTPSIGCGRHDTGGSEYEDKKSTKSPNFRLFVLTATFCHPNYNYIEICTMNFLQLPLGLMETQYEKKGGSLRFLGSSSIAIFFECRLFVFNSALDGLEKMGVITFCPHGRKLRSLSFPKHPRSLKKSHGARRTVPSNTHTVFGGFRGPKPPNNLIR